MVHLGQLDSYFKSDPLLAT